MSPFLFSLFTFSRPIGYGLIFFGMAIEGDFLLLIIAFLTHQGFFDLGDMIIVTLAGAFLGDIAWLLLGRHLDRLSPFTHRLMSRLTKSIDRHLQEKPARVIFISKFTYGIHRAVLIKAGQNGLGLKEFLKIDIPAVIVWVTVVGGIGYLGSASLELAKHYIRYTELGLLLVIILFFLVAKLFSHYSAENL